MKNINPEKKEKAGYIACVSVSRTSLESILSLIHCEVVKVVSQEWSCIAQLGMGVKDWRVTYRNVSCFGGRHDLIRLLALESYPPLCSFQHSHDLKFC